MRVYQYVYTNMNADSHLRYVWTLCTVMYIHMYVYSCVSRYIHIYVYMHIHIHAYKYTYMYMYICDMYIHIHGSQSPKPVRSGGGRVPGLAAGAALRQRALQGFSTFARRAAALEHPMNLYSSSWHFCFICW